MDDSAINDLLGHSITYCIAVGPRGGRKAFTLQTVLARQDNDDNSQVANANAFSLYAGVAPKAHQRRKLERLCRTIARPAVSTEPLALTSQGNIRYTLKTPYRDGTTHIILQPLDFIARLAALVPKPRVNPTRFHGVFAPNRKHRSQVTPARRGKRPTDEDTTPDQRHTAMTWAQRLKPVFTIDFETCEQCGAAVKVIASIEDPAVIQEILGLLQTRTESPQTASHLVPAPPAYPEPDQT